MFAVLKEKDREKGVIKRLSSIFKNPINITCEQVDSVSFHTIEIKRRFSKINWKKAAEICGKYKNGIIFAGIVPPPEYGIHEYCSKNYMKKVMLNTIVSAVKKTKKKANKIKICFADPDGTQTGQAVSLLSIAGTVQILTNNRAAYESIENEVMEKYGTAFSITCIPACMCRFDYLYMPSGDGECKYPLIFVKDIFNKYMINESCVKLPEIYKKSLPKNVNEAAFAAALYETSNILLLGKNKANMLVQNAVKKTFPPL